MQSFDFDATAESTLPQRAVATKKKPVAIPFPLNDNDDDDDETVDDNDDDEALLQFVELQLKQVLGEHHRVRGELTQAPSHPLAAHAVSSSETQPTSTAAAAPTTTISTRQTRAPLSSPLRPRRSRASTAITRSPLLPARETVATASNSPAAGATHIVPSVFSLPVCLSPCEDSLIATQPDNVAAESVVADCASLSASAAARVLPTDVRATKRRQPPSVPTPSPAATTPQQQQAKSTTRRTSKTSAPKANTAGKQLKRTAANGDGRRTRRRRAAVIVPETDDENDVSSAAMTLRHQRKLWEEGAEDECASASAADEDEMDRDDEADSDDSGSYEITPAVKRELRAQTFKVVSECTRRLNQLFALQAAQQSEAADN